jgi:hypothetical protein
MVSDITATTRTIDELEAVVDQGKLTFLEVGTALLEIRDRQLYRERGYERFDLYTLDRFGIHRSQAFRLMDVPRVLAVVSPAGDSAPTSERQVRELTPLVNEDPAAAARVWNEVVRERPNPPAPLLRERVQAELKAKFDKARKGAQPAPKPAPPLRGRPVVSLSLEWAMARPTFDRVLELDAAQMAHELASEDRRPARREAARLRQWLDALDTGLDAEGVPLWDPVGGWQE